jgi:hypothetical protein
MAVFFAETAAVLAGYKQQESYSPNYEMRVIKTLRVSPRLLKAKLDINKFTDGKNPYTAITHH